MDPLIDAYVTTTFSPEQGVSIFEAFALFDNFDVQDYQQSFIDMLMVSDMYHKEQLQDMFYNKVVDYTDFVFKHHMIALLGDTPLRYRVEFLQTLHDLQELDDYEPVLVVLESSLDAFEKMAFLVGHISALPEEEAITYLEHVDPMVLDNLYRYICNKTNTDNLTELDEQAKQLIANLKLFKRFLKDRSALGIILLENGALPNQTFEKYLPYIDNYFLDISKRSARNVAEDVLSLLYLSADGYKNPFEVYKTSSAKLFDKVGNVMKVEIALTNLVGDFLAYKEAVKHEKA